MFAVRYFHQCQGHTSEISTVCPVTYSRRKRNGSFTLKSTSLSTTSLCSLNLFINSSLVLYYSQEICTLSIETNWRKRQQRWDAERWAHSVSKRSWHKRYSHVFHLMIWVPLLSCQWYNRPIREQHSLVERPVL